MGKEKKRTDGRYQKSVTVGLKDGKPVRRVVYGKTRKELEQNYLALKADIADGIIGKKMTVEELLKVYMESEKTGLREKTLVVRKCDSRIICKHIGSIDIADLTEMDVTRMKMEMMQTPVQFNSCLVLLRSALRYALVQNAVRRNVAENVSRIRHTPKEKRALTPDEIAAIRSAQLEPSDRALVDLLYYTGVRIGEALALEKADIDFARKKVIVNKSANGLTKTPAGVRMISMPEPLIAKMKEYVADRPDGKLFPSTRGGCLTPNTFYHRWHRIKYAIFGDDAPADFTPHIFRHNYASDLYKAGVDLKSAQYLLGHTDIKTTLGIYTHFGELDVDIQPLDLFYKNREQAKNVVKL